MREISRLTKETIHLGALDEDSIVYIHKIDSMYNLRMYSRIGRRNPLYSTAIGKVLLAWRDREEVKQILEGVEYKQSTSRTITSTDALLTVLDRVREQGYGEDNEEQEEGLRCIGVPVFDRFGVVIAGLSISFPPYASPKSACMSMWLFCTLPHVRFLNKWVITTTRFNLCSHKKTPHLLRRFLYQSCHRLISHYQSRRMSFAGPDSWSSQRSRCQYANIAQCSRPVPLNIYIESLTRLRFRCFPQARRNP